MCIGWCIEPVRVFKVDCTVGLRRCDRWRRPLILKRLLGYFVHDSSRPPLFFVIQFDYFLMANVIAKKERERRYRRCIQLRYFCKHYARRKKKKRKKNTRCLALFIDNTATLKMTIFFSCPQGST